MNNNIVFSKINQRLSYKKKDKTWRKQVVDALCSEGSRKILENTELQENYDIYNSQLPPEMFNSICDTLNLNKNTGVKYIQKFNVLQKIIDAFIGEELDRPFALGVINNNPDVVNEVVAERDYKFRKYLTAVKNYTLERIKKTEELDAKYQESINSNRPMSMNKYKTSIEDINKMLSDKYKHDLDVESINESVKNIVTVKEETVSKLLKLIMRRLKVPYIKNNTFHDVLKADRMFVEVRPNQSNTLPEIRELNVINVFYEDSPNVEFIQDRNYAGYVESMPFNDVIVKYDLSKDEIDKLFAHTSDGVYGTDDVFFRKKGLGPNDWQTRTQAGHFTNNIPIDVNGSMRTLPNYGANISQAYGKGLNAEKSSYYNSDYCTVYTVYWVSQRKVGFYTFQNEIGELETEIVPESFDVPKKANLEKFTPEEDKKNLFAKKKSRYVWYCDDDKYHSIEWKWIPEIWQGTRINDNLYKNVQPVQHAYQSLLDPYIKKLPIYGTVFNNRNTYSQSLTDRLKPWYKLYIIIMSKLLKTISNDKGILTFMNISMIDDNIGWENTLKLLEETGIVPYNPFNKTQGTAYSNTAKIAEKLDASNSSLIMYYIQVLEFIEQKFKSVADMSDQRLAEVKQHTGSQMNQNATTQSHKSSEVLFMKHDMVWEQIMQGTLEMLISMLNNSTGLIRGYLNNEEIALIELDNISLEDEYLLTLQTSNKMNNLIRDNYQMLHAMFQNDKIDLLTMIDLLEKDDIIELKNALRELQAKQQQMEKQQQEAEAAREKELLQLEIDSREDMQIAKLDEIQLKGKLDYNRDKMKSQMMNLSFDTEKDYNKDGIADFMQIEQLNQRIRNETEKNQIARESLALEKAKAADKSSLEREKVVQTKVKNQQDTALKNKEIVEKAKDRIAKRNSKV